MKHTLYTFTILSALSWLSCALPCPKNVKIGEVSFHPETQSFVPKQSNFKPLTFVSNNGKTVTFNTQTEKVLDRSSIQIETLCSRGDFLDKTTQISFVEAPAVNLWYTEPSDQFTLSINISLQNLGQNAGDTILIENVSVWSQDIQNPRLGSGILSIVTNTRGNDDNESVKNFISNNNYRIIADTTIAGRNMKNVYTNRVYDVEGTYIYFTKDKGIEGFANTAGQVFIRKD
jgi:hypothetical protein